MNEREWRRAPTWRSRAATILLTAGFAACGAARAPFATPTTSDRFFVAGYHPYWALDGWTAYPEDVLDELYFFEIEVAGDGSFLDRHGWPEAWRPMIDDALAAGLQVTPTVSMHDPVAFEALFRDGGASDRLVDNVVSLLVETEGLAGIQIDFEVFQPVDDDARRGFTEFVSRLAERMGAVDPELSLSVFTLAFDDDDAFDEEALAAVADYIVIQGYDYHSVGSARAGPVAALEGWGRLNWNEVVDRFVDLGVPPRKIVMAVPMYGYQWPVDAEQAGATARGQGVAIPYAPAEDVLPELPRARTEAERHGVLRDPVSGSPYYVYNDGTGWYQGWFDDAESLRAKYDFVRTRGLGGIAIFPAAYADNLLWDDLRSAFSRGRF